MEDALEAGAEDFNFDGDIFEISTDVNEVGAVSEALSEKGYKRISLAVQKANYAVRMYDRAGFRTILENDDEYIMVCDLLNEAEIYNDGKV